MDFETTDDLPYFTATCVFAVISLACNGLFVVVVARRPQLQHFTHICLSCIAVVDILRSILAVCTHLLNSSPHYFPLKLLACRLAFYLPHVLSLVFALCVSVIAVVQCGRQECMLKNKGVKKSLVVLMMIWVAAAVAVLPKFIYVELDQYDDEYVCMEGLQMKMIVEVPVAVAMLGVCSVVVVTSLVVAMRRRRRRSGRVGSDRKDLNEDIEMVSEDGEGVTKEVVVVGGEGGDDSVMDWRFDARIMIIWLVFFLIELLYSILTPLPAFYFTMATTISTCLRVLSILRLISNCYKLFLYILLDLTFRRQLKTFMASS